MVKFSESALKRLIKVGETATVELKLASPRPVEMAERLCGMANAQGGVVVVGVEDSERKIVSVPAVQYVNERGFITNSIYRELTRVSDRTASRDLEMPMQRG